MFLDVVNSYFDLIGQSSVLANLLTGLRCALVGNDDLLFELSFMKSVTALQLG